MKDLVVEKDRFPKLVIPEARDGALSHVLFVVDDIIVDSTLPYAVRLRQKTLNAICEGIKGIKYACTFKYPSKPFHVYDRKMKKNWN